MALDSAIATSRSSRSSGGRGSGAESASALEQMRTFEGWARDYYEPSAVAHYDRAIARMLRHLKPNPGSTILDAGCGTGVHTIRVARAGYRVHAVDISTVGLNQARHLAQQHDLAEHIQFEIGDVTHLPMADAAFEAIFCWGVISHVPNVDAALHELVRVLRPGGRLAIQTTNSRAWDQKIESLVRSLLRKPRKYAQVTAPGPVDWGRGWWDTLPDGGGRLWNRNMDLAAVKTRLHELGCRCVHHSASEATELQRWVSEPFRTLLRYFNRAWFALRLPATPACTNLMVFEKNR